MGVMDILAEINRLGGRVNIEGENIKITPKKVLTDEMRVAIRANKPQILNILQKAEIDGVKVDINTLYPLIRRKVLTPRGVGTLWQVFYCRIGVVLEKEPKRVEFFNPEKSGFYILPMDGDKKQKWLIYALLLSWNSQKIMAKKPDKKELAQFKVMFDAGITANQIGETMNRSHNTVAKYLYRADFSDPEILKFIDKVKKSELAELQGIGGKARAILNDYLDDVLDGTRAPQLIPIVATLDRTFTQKRLLEGSSTANIANLTKIIEQAHTTKMQQKGNGQPGNGHGGDKAKGNED